MRTLFVSGLPLDTRPRELYLLFRGSPGYKSSQLKKTNKNGKTSLPIGFVTFSSRSYADEARRELHGIRFDPECSQTLRLELAKQTTKKTKFKQITPPIISPNLPNNAIGMLPPPILTGPTAGYIPNAPSQTTANAAAAYFVAQQAAAMAAVQDSAANTASLIAMNGAAFDQFSFLTALSDAQQQQTMPNFSHLMPFVTTGAQHPAAFSIFPGLNSNTATSQISSQQAIAAAIAQFQQQKQVQTQQQQNAMAAIASANPFLTLPNPLPSTSQTLGQSVVQQQQAAAIMNAAAINAASNITNGNYQPCSTLFVANLGSNVNEEELRQLFKNFPGFSRLRMHTKGGSPIAFIEYQDVRQATIALNNLQGFQLSSLDRGNGIRIEFARTKMGDVSHNHTNNNINGSSNNNNNSNVSSLKVIS